MSENQFSTVGNEIEETPMENRFNLKDLENLIELLNSGYKIVNINSFIGKEGYSTSLEKDKVKKVFSTLHPLPIMLSVSSAKTREEYLAEQLQEILNQLKEKS